MIGLIKKGGLRERANRSRKYQGSENTETTLLANKYQLTQKNQLQNVCEKNLSSTQLTTNATHPATTTPQK
ncbi:hypothetical protein [Acinetobacter sp. CFCC 10889]|uniref:hypothetical protein n=1 Tax=Acinetobacter sp. CFCC 10889 TaxID=1775557 RepID=UPI000DCFF304|nr:hypothetical protein [Acinetobacter sp. CFCC 10889]